MFQQITKSLGTDDFSKAKKDFFLVMADIEQGFEVAKLSLSNVKEVEISIIQAERLAKIWFHVSLLLVVIHLELVFLRSIYYLSLQGQQNF